MTDTIPEAESALRKDAENTVKQHINTIWHNVESWGIEKIKALIADLQKHV